MSIRNPLLSRFPRERGDPSAAWGVRVCTPASARPSPPTALRWAPPLPRRAGEGPTVTLLRLPFHLLLALGIVLAAKGALIPAKAWAAQILLDRAFDRGLERRAPVKAWPWADAAPVARISVPRLHVSQIVLSGGSGEAMAFGPTHLPASAAIGDRSGTAVFAAHRDTHFRFLEHIRTGDEIRVETLDGRTWRYRIARTRIVRRDSYAPSGALALVTCWPFGATEHGPWRFVATAERM